MELQISHFINFLYNNLSAISKTPTKKCQFNPPKKSPPHYTKKEQKIQKRIKIKQEKLNYQL